MRDNLGRRRGRALKDTVYGHGLFHVNSQYPVYVLQNWSSTSSQSPFTARTSPLLILLNHSSVSPSQMLPVRRICWILPGISNFLNLAGRSWARMGMCKSPISKTRTGSHKMKHKRFRRAHIMQCHVPIQAAPLSSTVCMILRWT